MIMPGWPQALHETTHRTQYLVYIHWGTPRTQAQVQEEEEEEGDNIIQNLTTPQINIWSSSKPTHLALLSEKQILQHSPHPPQDIQHWYTKIHDIWTQSQQQKHNIYIWSFSDTALVSHSCCCVHTAAPGQQHVRVKPPLFCLISAFN